MLANVRSATLLGVDGHAVTVEVHLANGLPGLTIVGLPDATCREARDRVRAAIVSSGFTWPDRRLTVNLAPSAVRKAGAGLDLALALGVLVVGGDLDQQSLDGKGFVAELGLDGTLRPVPGALALVDAMHTEFAVVSPANAVEAGLVAGDGVRCASDLRAAVAALRGEQSWADAPRPHSRPRSADPPDLTEVRGQRIARQALEVAAAGAHHLLLVGPPGAGKTMLVRRLPGILPPLADREALTVTRIHSCAAVSAPPDGLVRHPPLRAPHHGISAVAMIGGGAGTMRPGEISLAHRGVLFLDEMGEFPLAVLEGLRTPLEEGVVRVARAASRVEYPARFLLVGAMNPCPCGAALAPGSCRCSDAQIARYSRRLSGPLLDRFDLRVEVRPPEAAALLGGTPGESSAAVRQRVMMARDRAAERGVLANAELHTRDLDREAPLDAAAAGLLERSLHAGRLSARGMRRVRAVALTIADLAGDDPPITEAHLSLAMALRGSPRFADRRLAS